MRVKLLTLHAIKNYGSVLQAFATQKIFESIGFDVEIINYIREDVRDENILKTWCGNNIAKKIIMISTVKKWKKVFDTFYKENLKLTTKIYTTENDFKDFTLDADVYCTGSDQVWNSIWNNGILYPLYLNFVPKSEVKIAFAASFGTKYLSQKEVEMTRELISEYSFISVRESSAKEILNNLYDYKNVTHIIDPTLILHGDIWRNFSTAKTFHKDYILIYNLNRDKKFDKYAQKLSQITGFKLLRLCTRYDQIFRIGKSVVIPEIFNFINLIDNAKYILTDSFHATAFALNLHTNPICIYPPEFSDRIASLLKLTQTEDRCVTDYNDFTILNRSVNFIKVDELFDRERSIAFDFLKNIYNSVKLRKVNDQCN